MGWICSTLSPGHLCSEQEELFHQMPLDSLLTIQACFSVFCSDTLEMHLLQLGKMRLTIPCRAVTCTHLQCFDAALYLQMNEKKPTWICPVCDKKAAYESLILDG